MTGSRTSQRDVLPLLAQFFAALDDDGVKYCVWKNLHEVADALAGDGDIDIYVSPGNQASFQRALRASGFIRVVPQYPYPCIEHYYGFDRITGLICHLHVYYRIVTGESHVKQYVLPVEALIERWPSHTDKHGLRVMHPQLMQRLAAFRRSIKLSCLPGLILFLRERRGYATERALLDGPADTTAPVAAPVAAPVDRAGANGQAGTWIDQVSLAGNTWREAGLGLVYRWRFRALSRLGGAQTLLVRYGHLLVRPVNKLARRRKRFEQGVIIGVVGLDGSGKSSNVEMLSEWLGKQFDVKQVHYGHGRRTLPTLLVRVGLAVRKRIGSRVALADAAPGDAMSEGRTSGVVAHVRYLALAYERRRVLAEAMRAASRGSIVISDRWYSLDRGKMDSPRLDPTRVGGLRRVLAHMENRLYAGSPDPDLLFRFEVDEAVAIKRNRAREKADKETDAQISKRFRLHSNLNYRCTRQVVVDNNRDRVSVRDQVLCESWELLRERQL